MAKSKQQKKESLQQLNKDVDASKAMVFLGYHGLSVAEIEDLRKKLRQEGVEMKVVKKTLLQKALAENKIDAGVKELGAGLAVLFGKQDEASAAKVLVKFKKDHEVVQILGGILERSFIDQAKVIVLSKLLSREELYTKLVGSINAPVSGFVNVLAGTIRGLVNALNGIKDAKFNNSNFIII